MMGILIGAAYISVSQTIRVRDTSQSRGEAMTRASSAVALIAEDASNALRDADLTNCRVLITRDGKPGEGRDGLLLFSHLNRSVRPTSTEAEGEEGEVQFRLQSGDAPDSLSLWRRTDPVVDEFPDGGGVASALVDGVKSVNIQAHNGTDWVDDWDSDIDGIPYAIRVTVTGSDDKGRASLSARRVIALDRVPLPKESEDLADAAQAAADAAASATTSNTGTNTNTNTGNTNTGLGNTSGRRNVGGNGLGNGNTGGGRGNGNGNGTFGGGNGNGGRQGGGRGNGNGQGGQGGQGTGPGGPGGNGGGRTGGAGPGGGGGGGGGR
jgi:hypothetical protein